MAVKKTFEFFFGPLLKKFFQDMGRDPNNLEMILLRQKAGKLFKDSNKVINFPQKRSFKEEIEAMKKSGDLVDEDNVIISDKITDREMFKNSNLNKPTVEGQMEKITGASNKIKQIQKEQADMYKPKSDAEIKAKFEKQNKEAAERLRNKKQLTEDEYQDFLDEVGGADQLEAYNFDGTVGDAKRIIKEQKAYMADMELEYKKGNLDPKPGEANRERFLQKKFDEMEASGDNRLMTREEIEELSSFGLQKDMDKSVKKFKEKDAKQKKTLKDFDPEDRDPNATGGRAGLYTGGMVDVEPNLSDIGHGSDALMARTRLVAPDSQATTSTGLNYLLAEDNDNIRVPFGKGGLTPEDYLKVKDMLDHYFNYKKGGGTMSKKNFGTAFFRENNAEGGRIGFSGGGDPKRRLFLKLLATLTGGIAGVKSGLIGLGEGGAKKAITETVKQSAGGTYPPPYFFKLVEKIKFMGDDITEKAATQEREIVKRYKDYEMTEDISTGQIVIKKRNEGVFYDQDGIISDEYIVYKPGQADELTKGKKPPAEYDEYTVRPDSDGKLRDSEDGLDSIDEILKEVGDPDSMTLKKADGGRIGFSGGGIFRAIIAKAAVNAGKTPYEFIKKTGYKSLPPRIKMFMSKSDYEKLKFGQEEMYSNYVDMAKTRKNFQDQIEGGKNTPARELFEGMEKIMDDQSYVPRNVTDKDIAEMELMVKNRFNKGRKDNAEGGLQTMLGE